MSRTVSFLQMKDGTKEDYLLLDESEREYARHLPEKILGAVRELDHSLEGYPVSRLTHSLQTATRALNDGADDDMVVAALIHDVGDMLAPYNHADVAAALLKPYVRPEVTWIVQQHGLFQSYYYVHYSGGDRNARDRFKDHRWYQSCESFCSKWDQSSFDPKFPTLPLSAFEPAVHRVFSRKAHDPRYVKDGL